MCKLQKGSWQEICHDNDPGELDPMPKAKAIDNENQE